MRELPIVMPTCRTKMVAELNDQFPGRVASLFSPGAWKNPKNNTPYALDNGRFPVWSSGKVWSEGDFEELIRKALSFKYPPLWVAVPDVVADPRSTILEYGRRAGSLGRLGWPLAIVVQDGMLPADVAKLRPIPDVIFVGGTTDWKWRTLRTWTKFFPRVHVGRVNTGRMLWAVHRSGAESSDGTGWWHHKQHAQLVRYLERSGKGSGERRGVFFTDDEIRQCSKS